MLVKFQSFPQVGRGENKKTWVATIYGLNSSTIGDDNHPTFYRKNNEKYASPNSQNSTRTFSSTSPIRVPWSHLRCTWQRFRHSSKPVALPKRTGIPKRLPTPKTQNNKKHTPVFMFFFFWRKHIAVIKKVTLISHVICVSLLHICFTKTSGGCQSGK